MKQKIVSKKQLSLLPARIRKAEETDATQEMYSYLWKLYKEKNFKPINVLIVGAGGSYPAALAASHSIRDEMRTPNVDVATPQTALQILKQFDRIINCCWHPNYDLVIGISYSGKSPDIKAVANACRRKDYPFMLLTGANKTELKELYHEDDSLRIVSYFNAEDNSGKEKGMISMAATLIPAVLFDDYVISTPPTRHYFDIYRDYLKDGKKFVSELNISDIIASIEKNPIVHVFYDWETLPTAADIETKFIEAGIANVVLHEKKNFSHGRSTILSTQEFGMIINLTKYSVSISLSNAEIKENYKNEYDKKLSHFLSALCETKSAYYLEFGSGKFETAQWNLEAMSMIPYLIAAIGEEMNIDISESLSPFSKEAISLHDYKGEF